MAHRRYPNIIVRMWTTLEQSHHTRNRFTWKNTEIQGLHPMTRSEAATGSLGLWSMDGTIDKAKLLYFGRLCRLHETLLTKKIFTERLSSYYIDPNKQTIGFIPDIIQILDKYSLGNYLSTYIEENTLPAKLSWTKIVYDHINEFEIEKWKNGMLGKDELLFYRRIHRTLKPLHLWEAARRNPLEKTSIATLVHWPFS